MLKILKRHNTNLGFLLLRLGLAVVFIMHGWPKVQDIAGTAAFFGTLGLGMFWAYVVAYVEFIGGIAMLVGVMTRLAGLLLAIDMAFAIYLVKYASGFNGYEFELSLLLMSLAVFFVGSGKYAIKKD